MPFFSDGSDAILANGVPEKSIGLLAFAEATGVAVSTLTTVASITAVADVSIAKVVVSGELYGKVILVVDTADESVKRMGPDRFVEWNFDGPYTLPAGSTLDVKVIHFATGKTPDYEASIYG